MKYIIADPDETSSIELKNILDDIKILDFQGSFTTVKETEKNIRGELTDIAFIRMGKSELNAFELMGMIREYSPFSRIIFISKNRDDAVQAFEYGANGFLIAPFSKEKIKHSLQKSIVRIRD